MAGKTKAERARVRWGRIREDQWLAVLDSLQSGQHRAAKDLLSVIKDLDKYLGEQSSPDQPPGDVNAVMDRLKAGTLSASGPQTPPNNNPHSGE